MNALERILHYKREEVTRLKARTPIADLEDRARAASPTRGFAKALAAADGIAIIAEIKRASPSKGLIREDFTPEAHARSYAEGGATCLSVLTDGPSFQGADAHLIAARAACTLPCLRKDFMVDPVQVVEARGLGADAILVILAAVADGLARDLAASAAAWGMDVLYECHDREELDRAIGLGAHLIGVNNRDLRTFETRLDTTESLAQFVPEGALLIAESGIHSHSDLARLAACGARAALVGESLMRAPDPGAALRALRGVG